MYHWLQIITTRCINVTLVANIYNLGIVDHAHIYDDGRVTEHMHCHVYHEGVGKKGANNVSSLIMKTLRGLNLLREDSVGGELNIVGCRDRIPQLPY